MVLVETLMGPSLEVLILMVTLFPGLRLYNGSASFSKHRNPDNMVGFTER